MREYPIRVWLLAFLNFWSEKSPVVSIDNRAFFCLKLPLAFSFLFLLSYAKNWRKMEIPQYQEPEEVEHCKDLWVAVIIQALTDLHNSNLKIKEDAKEFLASSYFSNLISCFNLDQDSLESLKKVRHSRFISRHRNESKSRIQPFKLVEYKNGGSQLSFI